MSDAGLDVPALVKRSGIARQLIHNYLSGTQPGFDKVQLLAKATGKDLNFFASNPLSIEIDKATDTPRRPRPKAKGGTENIQEDPLQAVLRQMAELIKDHREEREALRDERTQFIALLREGQEERKEWRALIERLAPNGNPAVWQTEAPGYNTGERDPRPAESVKHPIPTKERRSSKRMNENDTDRSILLPKSGQDKPD